jgi:hypothetical protein
MAILNTKGKSPNQIFKDVKKRPERNVTEALSFPGMSPSQIERATKGVKDVDKARKQLSEDCIAAAAKKKKAPIVETATDGDAGQAETATMNTKKAGNNKTGKPELVKSITGDEED